MLVFVLFARCDARLCYRALAKRFGFNMGDAKCECVRWGTKLPVRGIRSEKVRELGRG